LLRITRSRLRFFVKVPTDCQPYEPGDPANRTGTLDRLFIHGSYYSDKSPVPSILMAGAYGIARAAELAACLADGPRAAG
jgi:hypothetical protein